MVSDAGRWPATQTGRRQLEDERQPCGQRRAAGGAQGGRRPGDAEVAVCVPFPYLAEVALALHGQRASSWGAQDCSSARAGRLHRRGVGGDAGRVRLPLRASSATPSGARCTARATSWWPTRPRRRWRTADADRLRRRDAGRARSRPDRRGRQAPARRPSIHTLGHCIAADRRRLRAGLGHRHRQDGHARAGAGRARACCARSSRGRRRTPARCASSTAAASRPTTRRSCSRQPDIDGGLIGGASLKAADFVAICRAARLTRAPASRPFGVLKNERCC